MLVVEHGCVQILVAKRRDRIQKSLFGSCFSIGTILRMAPAGGAPYVLGLTVVKLWKVHQQCACAFLPMSMLTPPLTGAGKSMGMGGGQNGGGRERNGARRHNQVQEEGRTGGASTANVISYLPSQTQSCTVSSCRSVPAISLMQVQVDPAVLPRLTSATLERRPLQLFPQLRMHRLHWGMDRIGLYMNFVR